MIEATVLADALVEAGIGEHDLGYPASLPTHGYSIDRQVMSAEYFITDWRVAGKCLESMSEGGCCSYFGHDTTDTYLCTYRKGWGHRRTRFHGVAVNPCTAIIEAWYAATEQGESDG